MKSETKQDYNMFPTTRRGKQFLAFVVVLTILFVIWFFINLDQALYANSWDGWVNPENSSEIL